MAAFLEVCCDAVVGGEEIYVLFGLKYFIKIVLVSTWKAIMI